MTFTFKNTALTLTALTAIAAFPALHAHKAQAEEAAFSDAQKAVMGDFVKDYLMDNPKVIFDAIEAYRAQQEQEAQNKAKLKIDEHIGYLTGTESPSIGNPDADITIVEFFDYNCGYCKKALPDIQKIVESDKNVRVVFKELPILGPTSRTAAIWALAAHKQDKYFDYHVALMNHRGPKDEKQLEKLAKDIGLDVDQVKKDIASGEIEKALDKSSQVSREIGVTGTPAFVVGKTFIGGYVGEAGLKQAVEDERKKAENDG